MKTEYNSIDHYLALQPKEIATLLEQIRKTIKEVLPTEAKEVISYQMPAFKLNKVLVYFAAFKNHIGFYPTASGIVAFEKELTDYNYSKGAIQFSLDKPIPFDLIKKITKYRLEEDLKKSKK